MSRRFSTAVPALALLLIAATVSAQGWRGPARANGLVQSLGGEPIAGARVLLRPVLLRPVAVPGEGPDEVVTEESGRWAVLGLAGGRWEIRVQADGYIESTGWIEVSESTPNFPVKIRLRPLDEVSPTFSEGSPATLQGWIDKGNSLLDQERYAEAREEYSKALRQLPEESRPELLRAVARTWFMESDLAGTLRALHQALYWDPSDDDTRRLYSTLLAELGREEEAEELLAALDREGREVFDETKIFDVEERPSFGTLPPEIADLQVLSAVAGRSGRYRVRFTTGSPWSDMTELLSRLGMSRKDLVEVDPARGRYDLGEESFHVYAPPDDDPEPWGLFVWISPTGFGGFVSEDVRAMLERHRLIWIGADDAGNPRLPWYRFALALDAVANMKRLYEIDERRIYVAGYSGGGRVTSGLAMLWPEVFAGGFSIYGCDYFRRVRLPDKPGAFWPSRLREPDKPVLREIMENRRFVLLTGELDFNRAQTLATWERMVEDGFRHASYLEIPGASHYTRVPLEWLDKAVRALDAPHEAGSAE